MGYGIVAEVVRFSAVKVKSSVVRAVYVANQWAERKGQAVSQCVWLAWPSETHRASVFGWSSERNGLAEREDEVVGRGETHQGIFAHSLTTISDRR